jgi:hypothetical protein
MLASSGKTDKMHREYACLAEDEYRSESETKAGRGRTKDLFLGLRMNWGILA